MCMFCLKILMIWSSCWWWYYYHCCCSMMIWWYFGTTTVVVWFVLLLLQLVTWCEDDYYTTKLRTKILSLSYSLSDSFFSAAVSSLQVVCFSLFSSSLCRTARAVVVVLLLSDCTDTEYRQREYVEKYQRNYYAYGWIYGFLERLLWKNCWCFYSALRMKMLMVCSGLVAKKMMIRMIMHYLFYKYDLLCVCVVIINRTYQAHKITLH